MDLSVYGWMTQDGDETTHDVGASLGINVELLLDGLYPSIGVTIAGGQTKRPTVRLQEKECPTYHGEPHCPVVRGQGNRPPGHGVGVNGERVHAERVESPAATS